MSNILTKTPTVVMIADEVQQQSRNLLERFIGMKFLPGILSQIEGRLAMMLKASPMTLQQDICGSRNPLLMEVFILKEFILMD